MKKFKFISEFKQEARLLAHLNQARSTFIIGSPMIGDPDTNTESRNFNTVIKRPRYEWFEHMKPKVWDIIKETDPSYRDKDSINESMCYPKDSVANGVLSTIINRLDAISKKTFEEIQSSEEGLTQLIYVSGMTEEDFNQELRYYQNVFNDAYYSGMRHILYKDEYLCKLPEHTRPVNIDEIPEIEGYIPIAGTYLPVDYKALSGAVSTGDRFPDNAATRYLSADYFIGDECELLYTMFFVEQHDESSVLYHVLYCNKDHMFANHQQWSNWYSENV